MLLVMHNLPAHIKYSDIKILIRNKCDIDDIILDKLVKDGISTKKVTIGVAKEDDAIIIMRRLNGTFVEGLQVYIEEVKKGNPDKSVNRNSSIMDYANNQSQNQMKPGYPMYNAWSTQNLMYQKCGYVMPNQTDPTGYQAKDTNSQAMNMLNYGYTTNAVNTLGIAPLMQSNYMAYGNLQGQPQLNAFQGQFGPSGSEAQTGSSHKSGSNIGNARSQNRGYDSDNVQKDNDSRRYAGNDRGFDSQNYQGDSRQNTRDYGSRNVGSRFELDAQKELYGNREEPRRFDSQESWGNRRGFSQGNDRPSVGDRKRHHSPERGRRDIDFQSEFGSQGFESDSRGKGFGGTQGRGFDGGSRGKGFGGNQGRGFDSDSRGEGFGGNQGRGFDSGSRGKGFGGNQDRGFDSDSRGKGFGGNGGRGFENDSRTGFGDRHGRDSDNDSRDRGFGNNRGISFQRDSRNLGLGNRGFQGESWGEGLGGDQGRGFERNRNTGLGNNQDKFESDSRGQGFGNNQNRGFGNDPRGNAFDVKQERGFGGRENFNRRGSEVTPNPNPYSWSNTSNPTKTVKSFDNKPSLAKPFDIKPSFPNTKPLNDREPRPIHNPGPPLSQSSPVKPVIPVKRPKIEDFPKCDVAPTDKKTQNRVLNWRAMGVSIIVKSILERFMVDELNQNGSKAFKQSVRNLKRAINGQLLGIIKQRYPKNPYPLLHEHQIVALYRLTHPESEDLKLVKDHFPSEAKPKPEMFPPNSTTVPQPKPMVPKPLNKPTLSDLLPPSFRQNNPRQLRQKPAKKPKPVDLEKRAKQERRMLHKTEFLDESLYKCKTPAMEKALNDVLDEITNVYNNAVDGYETTDKDEKIVGQGIISKTSAEFRSTVRLHTIKRILNETSTLMLRIFINGGKAPKTEVERVLQPYGVTYLKASKMSKTHMLMACVDSFENFDTLCLHTGVACNGRDGTTSYVTAKPLHLTIPMKFRRLLRQKKLQENDDDEVDFNDDVELPDDDDVELPGDDDLEQPGDEDDDVIEVVKETDIIELSGDENVLKVPNEIQHDVKSAKIEATSGSATKNTVDLTHEDDDFADDVNETVDDKISAEMGDGVVEIDEEGIREDDLEDY